MYASIVMFVSVIIGWPIWSTKAPLPQPLAGSGCAFVGDTIYVIGGRDSPGNCCATNYAYDPYSDSWTIKTPMPTARAHLGCAAVNGKIYAIGGWYGNTASGAVEEYDPATNTWEIKNPMPTPRYTFGIAAVADKIYVIGGMNTQPLIFTTVEEYDPLTDTWATRTPMPTPRMDPGCAALYDTIYVFGGSTTIGSGVTTANERYDPAADAWATRASMPTARYALGGFSWYNRVFALGGYDYWSYHTTLEEYMPSTNTWSTLNPMQYARQSVAIGMIPQYVYVIGGWNNGALDYNDEGWFEIGIEEYKKAQPMVSIDISPNPFTDFTDIRIQIIDTRQKCEIKIHDITGRLVTDLSAQISVIGHQSSVTWNGKDNQGCALPNGTYLVVCGNDRTTKIEKVVLAR
ncbi:T9SS type A sorting domain-containing protein [candidate division WOR-3 bacterium]|nr:T9SS type A sorting domain-containing protein [candidate division WOR-3 bacterium]